MLAINRGILRFGQRHTGAVVASGATARANNEALMLILTLTVAHFIVYTPYPILWALRASAGGILSQDSTSFLIGTL